MKTRQSSRQSLEALATCRNMVGRQWETMLSEVSDGGCRLLDPSQQIRKGERLHIYFADTGPHMVQATWRRGDEVGLAFRTPLTDSLLSSLEAHDWSATGAKMPDDGSGAQAIRFV